MAEFATETQRTNKPIDTHHNIKLFTFNAILFFIFGSRTQDVQILQANFDNFVIWMAGLGDIFIPEFMNGPFAKAMVARTKLTSILLAIIKERQSDGLNKILFGNHEGIFLSDNELVDNLLVMIFVGHDTSTGSISSSIHYWANEMAPEEKEMLLREIEDVDGTNMTELLALPVLDAFMKEVLRMAAPATAILRKLNQDADILGHVVPSGSVLMLPYGALSYNPDVFPEPNKFNIARFLDLSAQDAKKQAYAYSPFGLGARQCLGMHLARLELKIFMFQLLKSFVVLKSDIPSVIEGFPVMMVKPQVKVLSVLEKHYA
ncbi:cytochrome P450 [Rhizoclosmatium globosum]|uniref:Cytochrome P450 n=1 Tax=Rhizoclosmatium globosum TaxID=329046 RepID=A0A1Y2D0T7_9FUNG|nr:cytochrome P450 [Rhizoclosmatium globosum]|eukprot:ORY52903.1 cytochrome P450 [Rhizoclosmatium globosum]